MDNVAVEALRVVRRRSSHILEIRLTDDCDVFSLTRRQPFYPQEDCWYSFLLGAESTSGL
jgi:hypothetical protein